ncbi:hypothetical protein OG800_44930 [Streptomyces sp. NBC_00445]|uniref:Rv1733c family protein n=1 Tax=unclassified Streptomyces TaxID=2593676 RepID=UPI002E1C4073|nr:MULTISPECIES: hypothetical protein [unclassified Streptomyces]
MVRTRRPTVRMWRWRRNPLRRRIDVVEAWLVLGAWILAVVCAVPAGLVTQSAVREDLDRQRVERQQVTAVLVADAGERPTVTETDGDLVWADARWTAPDGQSRTGLTKVRPDTPAGSRVTVWTDQAGALAAEPVSPGEARLQSVLAGVLAGAVAGAVVIGGSYGVRAMLDRRRMAQWDAEWERVDTRRGGRTG